MNFGMFQNIRGRGNNEKPKFLVVILLCETYLFDSFGLSISFVTVVVGCAGCGGSDDSVAVSTLDKRRICLSTILDSGWLLFLSVWLSSIDVAISPSAKDERSSASLSSSSDRALLDGIANFLSSSSVIEPFERRCSLFKLSFD